MNIKKIITVGVAGVAMGAMALDNVEVTDVKARQRYPWNGKVDIDFKLDSKPTEPYQMQVDVFDNVGKTNLPVKAISSEGVSFDGNPCMVRTDTSRIVWDASRDLPNGFKSTNVLVSCRDVRAAGVSNLYMIVDLAGGSSADSFPVTYTNCPPPGGWTETHMTEKLVLRRMNAASFYMGSKESEGGHCTNEVYHKVTLTKPYYVGIYELTEAQMLRIVGSGQDNTKPILIDWYAMRGADITLNETYESDGFSGYYWVRSNGTANDYTWPFSDDVDPNSLMGRLRAKTGLHFDLPTEAQWENACRSGAATPVYLGTENTSVARALVGGDPKYDPTGTHLLYVGQYVPNACGVYDIASNVPEWCLDVYCSDLGTADVQDPVGGDQMIEKEKKMYTQYYWKYFYLNGYERVVRGSGARSAERSSALTLNLTSEKWKSRPAKIGYVGDDWDYVNPSNGVRLVVSPQ